jgi:hypothetical protein
LRTRADGIRDHQLCPKCRQFGPDHTQQGKKSSELNANATQARQQKEAGETAQQSWMHAESLKASRVPLPNANGIMHPDFFCHLVRSCLAVSANSVFVWSKQKSISTKGSSFYVSNNKIQTQQLCLTRETETKIE